MVSWLTDELTRSAHIQYNTGSHRLAHLHLLSQLLDVPKQHVHVLLLQAYSYCSRSCTPTARVQQSHSAPAQSAPYWLSAGRQMRHTHPVSATALDKHIRSYQTLHDAAHLHLLSQLLDVPKQRRRLPLGKRIATTAQLYTTSMCAAITC
jgi:hypothetical protein